MPRFLGSKTQIKSILCKLLDKLTCFKHFYLLWSDRCTYVKGIMLYFYCLFMQIISYQCIGQYCKIMYSFTNKAIFINFTGNFGKFDISVPKGDYLWATQIRLTCPQTNKYCTIHSNKGLNYWQSKLNI